MQIEMVTIHMLIIFAVFSFLPKMEADVYHRPLCASQFAIVSHACAGLPYYPLPPSPEPPEPPSPGPDDGTSNGHSHVHPPANGHGHDTRQGHGHVDRPGHSHRREHRHGHRHDHDGDEEDRPGHDGDGDAEDSPDHDRDGDVEDSPDHDRDGDVEDSPDPDQGYNQTLRHEEKGVEPEDRRDNCCKWLKSLDDECVCGLLYHLPPFLSKLAHAYTIYVDGDCDVSFKCSGAEFEPSRRNITAIN